MSLRSFLRGAALALLVSAVTTTLHAAFPIAPEAKPGYDEVDLFAAIERGEIIATVHVRNAEQLNLALENKTDRKLAVRLPDAFAAVPVHAQFQPGNFQNFNQNNNNAGNQGVGLPGGPLNQGPNQGINGGNGNGIFNNPGIFHVPPGKIVRAKRPCVCLEHGKDDPQPRIDYELRPIEQVIDDPQVAAMLSLLAMGAKQRVVQLAVWHRANGVSWDDLAAKRIDRLRGPDAPQYTSAEIETAQTLVKEIARGVKDAPVPSPGEVSARR